MNTIVIMAGGTGGHIYPALAVGIALRAQGVNVCWMGVRNGLEDELARRAGFEFDSIWIRGLWGKGLMHWLSLPLLLLISLAQSVVIILHRRPDLLLGMGGYVCGPGGMAAVILRRPLIIHESNAIAGLTNRLLAKVARRVLSGVEQSDFGDKAVYSGTPVRAEIIAAAAHKNVVESAGDRRLNLLVIGGSQGADALNRAMPMALAGMSQAECPNVMHQTGPNRVEKVRAAYVESGVKAQVAEYIDDMAGAYGWADMVVSRAGAMTIAELSVVGLAAVLVPYPHAARDHQRANAEVLSRRGAAIVCLENRGFESALRTEMQRLMADRDRVRELARRIRSTARTDATDVVLKHCLDVLSA